MGELAKLKQVRARVKGQLTRIANGITEKITATEAKIKLQKLEELWQSFEEVQSKIEDKEPEDEEQAKEFQKDCEGERQLFEFKYFEAAVKAQEAIDGVAAQQEVRHNGMQDNAQGIEIVHYRRNRPKLPEIKLPEFNGEYTKWLFFKNIFESTIHQDNDLLPMQKHQYLIGVLKGEARKVIEGFTISNENYENAWRLLKNTFDNQLMIIETHLEELMNIPAVSKDNKADSIRQIIWHIQTHMAALKAMAQPVEHWDTIVIHIAKKRLDYIEQRDWQDHVKNHTPDNMPTLKDFIKFLTECSHMLRMLSQNKPKMVNVKQPLQSKKKNEVVLATTAAIATCKLCKGNHPIYKCEELSKRTPEERRKLLIEKKHCVNCLNLGHIARECKASSCKKCGKKHNTLIHEDDRVDTKEEPRTDNHSVIATSSLSIADIHSRKPASQVILSTARIYVQDAERKQLVCRALLDPGSQSNLITADLAQRLKLPHINKSITISGIDNARSDIKKVVQISIKAMCGNFTANIECFVLPSITERLTQSTFKAEEIIIPKDVRLADSTFNKPGKIDLLIGAAIYWKILMGSPKNHMEGQPAFQNTQFGWIIGGEVAEKSSQTASTCFAVTNAQLQQQLERFWKQETLTEERCYTEEEKLCENQFVKTTQREADGRFVVRLPTRTQVILGESRNQAQKRFEFLERKLDRQPEIKRTYCEFMREYEKLHHMSFVENVECLKNREIYFIPHQAVIRPESTTTRLRVVFDASAKTTYGTSLNDKLMAGPNLQKDLFHIVLRFRIHEYVITADIKKMFRQILVHPEDRAMQLILWREDPRETLRVYQLNTVTYGTACAPYQAMRCLREIATVHGRDYPKAANIIQEDFYMDDALTGGRTLQETIHIRLQLEALLRKGQFYLHKWRSNDSHVLKQSDNEKELHRLHSLNKNEVLKTLGIAWDSAQDQLHYQLKLSEEQATTKREVLSKISQIFDPLGLIGPILVKGKIFMQQLWSEVTDWDQPLSREHLLIWNNYYSSLLQLNDLRIPRNVNPRNTKDKFVLYGFSDASERAYGACIYVVSTDDQNNTHSHLLCSRSRIAPLKTVTLPRLELEAAVLLSKLYTITKAAYKDRIEQVRLWSDSSIVLGWIKIEPQRLKTFVANRVCKIQEMTRDATWQHASSLWWHGPDWLQRREAEPSYHVETERNLPELRTTSVVLSVVNTADILCKYSSYSKLCRILAYCHRFAYNLRNERKIGSLDIAEILKGEKTIIRWIQLEVFSHELQCLQRQRELPKKSPLRSLHPFLDQENLMRVGGRLENAELSWEQRHQMLLPAKHFITRLIMRKEHLRLKHCPPEQLLNEVRQRYWPVGGRREAQRVVKNCVQCFRIHPTIPSVLMGDLPKERISQCIRPFAVTGIDYAGPFQVRESRRRGRINMSKGYVAVFVCFSTKAIHIEMVSELTTQAFLAALQRFTARRGISTRIFSDNGSNFVGASRELKELQNFLQKESPEISSFLAEQRIEWSFIPPRAPHFGGLWEAAVKSMKKHLYTETRDRVLTFEEYSTLLSSIEAVLNSRPLTPLTKDHNDFNVLTPAHFIIGDSLTQPASSNLLQTPDNRLNHWQHLQKIRQRFWQRWQLEYLQELQKRYKWETTGEPLEIGTLVLLVEDNTPPLRWPLGRIIRTYPGQDGEVRVVLVKTQTGTYKRAVRKLCPLPLDNELFH